MISHFQLEEIKNNLVNQEWAFSFFYKKKRYTGAYFKDGSIKWADELGEETKELESYVHELMLFHVYE